MKAPVPIPCLCLVTDRRMCNSEPRQLEEIVAAAVRGGVNLVQLREKDLLGGQLLELAERLRGVIEGSALLFINERVDVAMAGGADGVQLGEKALSVTDAREVAGESLLIGRSIHSLEGALAAQGCGADLLVAGPIFRTGSHPEPDAAGPELLSSIADKVGLPFVGIGGITASNVGKVMSAGASGAAVISAILGAGNPEQAGRELKDAIDESWQRLHPHQHSGFRVVSN